MVQVYMDFNNSSSHEVSNIIDNRMVNHSIAPNLIIKPKKDFAQISREVYELANSDNPISKYITHSLEVIEKSINLYGIDGLGISFNGGKDCVVLLYLFTAVIYKNFQNSEKKPNIQAIYIRTPNSFTEVEEFVNECILRYELDIIIIEGPMKQALQKYHECRPNVKAILIGTRRIDPHGKNLPEFIPTDPDWPPFIRVHPILDWNHHLVWKFLLALNVPYCILYDKGYTSIGGIDDTHPNPDLRNPAQSCGYDPAWKLVDENRERCGR
ncbi:hypothetical protein Glove_283g42 [Diversispora epigaea]|uniref:FAD synthase n=1 Tax=Diversispora epigaea TaxID=1348612 RepID=A0A397I2T9_9GLOM|nr:hypothetical protein Glove_283g42 [Diversispora epigaea]